MESSLPHHHLKPLISLLDLLKRDAATDDVFTAKLVGKGPGKTGTGLLLNESQPYDSNASESTQSRHRVALKNLQKIREKFKEPVYYLCLFASSVTALSKDPFKSGFWTALEQWPDRCNIPSGFTTRALRVIEAFHKKRKRQDHEATSQQKRRRTSPGTSEQLRLTNTPERVRVMQSGPVEVAGSGAIDSGQRLSVPLHSSLVTREENRRLQRFEEERNLRRNVLSHISARRNKASPNVEAQYVPRTVVCSGNKEDDDDDDDDNGNIHDQEDHDGYVADDSNHRVDEVHQNDGSGDNQCDGATKEPSLLASNTLIHNVGQLQMPHIHESELDVSHGSLQVPLQLHSQTRLEVSQDQLQMSHDQLGVSLEDHFVLSPATTQYTPTQADALYLPKFRGYLVPKAYLYEELAHYPEMVKLLCPLIPGSSPFFTVDVSETQARKYWAGRKRFM